MKWDGATWAAQTSGTSNTLVAVGGTGASNAWAVGAGLAVAGDSNVWVVGTGGVLGHKQP